MKKKACRECRTITTADQCPRCESTNFVTNWKGRIIVVDHSKSEIAKKMGIGYDGEFAIKVN